MGRQFVGRPELIICRNPKNFSNLGGFLWPKFLKKGSI
jgi:hypothetical protein